MKSEQWAQLRQHSFKKVEIENERTTFNYRKRIYIYESLNFKGIKLKERYSLTN